MIYVTLNGRLGADSEVKSSKNGNQFVSMRVASNDFANGERTTTWANVIWSGERALKMSQYMKKGSSVIINGTLRFSTYTDRNNEKAISVDVFADRIDFVDSGNPNSQQNEAVTDTGTFAPKNEPQTQVVTSTVAVNDTDDLPF